MASLGEPTYISSGTLKLSRKCESYMKYYMHKVIKTCSILHRPVNSLQLFNIG